MRHIINFCSLLVYSGNLGNFYREWYFLQIIVRCKSTGIV